MANVAARFPAPSSPLVDASGHITRDWLYLLQQMFLRTGGSTGGTVSAPGGSSGNVQYNSSGTFGGLTDVQLTARIQPFTSSLSGAAPGSGGGTANFLRADGAWTAPALSGTAGGDLSGTYPNPTVAKINGAALGSATATSGNLLIGSGSAWVTNAMSGDATINSGGTLTVGAINGGAVPASAPIAATNASKQVVAATTTGTGTTAVLAGNPTLAGATVDGNGAMAFTTQTSGAAAATGTLTNAPTAGNPGFWLKVSINGTARYIPAW